MATVFHSASCGLGLLAVLSLSSCGGGGMEKTRFTIQNTGSDTMGQLAQMWAEAYRVVDGTVSVEVSSPGSGVGISNLISGTVDIANSSRDLSAAEKAQIRTRTGKDPVEWVVGYDAIGIFAHRDNPIQEISVKELAEIYKEEGTVTKWSQLGIDTKAFCPRDEIIRVSRMSNSGTYAYFREHVLDKVDMKSGSLDMQGSKDVVELVGRTPCAVGYSGMGYKNDTVKFVKLAREKGQPAVAPSVEAVHDGTYPLARPLFMITLGQPAAHVKKYIDWIRSADGQRIVHEAGYILIKEAVQAEDSKK